MVNSDMASMTSRFFKSKEYFPIDVSFGEKEKIRISKRPRKGVTDIVDIYANQIHIGMFVGIEKVGKMLRFGPAGVNKSHTYRNITSFVFLKLLEYYGLDNLDAIVIDIPENKDFLDFLIQLGFITKDKRLMIELSGDKMALFLSKIDQNNVQMVSQIGQIEEIIKMNLGSAKSAQAIGLTNRIEDKIKNMDPLGKKFWDDRKISQLNVVLVTGVFHKERIWKHEFMEMAVKNIVSSFESNARLAYLEELLDALEGKRSFSMAYIQKMVENMKIILKDQIKDLHREEYREWIEKNLPLWKLNDKTHDQSRDSIIKDSRLRIEDFGTSIKEEIRPFVQSLVDHYNGENVFFGLANRF